MFSDVGRGVPSVPSNGLVVECSRLWVQTLAESYQRLKKWNSMPLCLALSIKSSIEDKWLSGQGQETRQPYLKRWQRRKEEPTCCLRLQSTNLFYLPSKPWRIFVDVEGNHKHFKNHLHCACVSLKRNDSISPQY